MDNSYIAVLGRQPKIGLAELEAVYGEHVSAVSENVVKITTPPNISRLGGTKKLGRIIATSDNRDILQACKKQIKSLEGKVTIGFSAFNSALTPYELQGLGIRLKKEAKKSGQSVRLIPNQTAELSTATTFHNKLGTSPNKIEFMLVGKGAKTIVAVLTEVQDINAYRERDQKRPKRDAFVGMLPPKLAQIMINLAVGEDELAGKTLLDPFCGTGVILQEALLLGLNVYGTDLSEKMIDYSQQNLGWLEETKLMATVPNIVLKTGDATSYKWRPPIDLVASETYLGQPFSAAPSNEKLYKVSENVQHIVRTFLKNLAPQIKSGTPLCLTVPAWRRSDGSFYRLKILDSLDDLGYNVTRFKGVEQKDLLYYREDQIVARELLVLRRK